MLDYYESLPDYMSEDELQKEFFKLHEKVIANYDDDITILRSYRELAIRQWHTYEFIIIKIRNDLEEYLINKIDIYVFNNVALITTITLMLGLKKIYDLFVNMLNDDLKEDIRIEINRMVDEANGQIENPYWSMGEGAK